MSERAEGATRTNRMAWLVWALGAMSFGYAFFQRVAPSAMVEDLMRDFAVTGAVLGNLSALYFYTYAILQIPIGAALDRWGPRLMLTVAMLVAGSGSVIFATAESIEVAYIGRLMIGTGAGVGFVGSLKLATHWFPPNRFAFVSGMSMLVAMIGGVIGQAPLATLVDTVGWRASLIGAGAFAVAMALATWLIVRDDPPGAPPRTHRESGGSIWRGVRQVLGEPQNRIMAGYAFVMSGPMLSYAGLWGVPHLMQVYGIERPLAAGTASLMLFGWMIGAPVSGWLSDRMGRRRRPMVLVAGAALAVWLFHLYGPTVPLAAAWVELFLIGGFSGGMVICYAAARESSPSSASGTAAAFVNTASVGSGALLQPLIGWILDRNWDGTEVDGARIYGLAAYDVALVTMPLCALTGLVLALLFRETYCRPRGMAAEGAAL